VKQWRTDIARQLVLGSGIAQTKEEKEEVTS
jgi:hypothetical protein